MADGPVTTAVTDDKFRPKGTRVRMTAEQRRAQIVEAAASLVTRYGSYGFSMQALADAVGLTLPGLGHYVRSREDLLTQIISTYYDTNEMYPIRKTDAQDANESADPLKPQAPHDADRDAKPCNYPAMIRDTVRMNAERPELVALFMRLSIEAADPHHPAHDFYASRHATILRDMTAIDWNLPPEYRDPERLHDLIVTVFFAMDGVQIQALTNPDESMVQLWERAERVLFPSPTWDGYR